MQETEKTKPGRPAGTRNVPGHRAGRPAETKLDSYAPRLSAWRAWWPNRPRRLTIAVLASRIEVSSMTIARWAGSHEPPETQLSNLERICAAYGYEPTNDCLFL